MGQLLPAYRPFTHRGSEDEQIAEELHHHRCELALLFFRALSMAWLTFARSAFEQKDALQRHTARQIRLLCLLALWNARMDFKEAAMLEVRTIETTLNVSRFLARMRA